MGDHFPVNLKHDTKEVFDYLVEELRYCLGFGTGMRYWAGTPEARCKHFVSLVQDVTTSKSVILKERILSELGWILISHDYDFFSSGGQIKAREYS